jgi:hypothetical protein
LNSPPPPFSFVSLPIPGTVSTGIIFAFTYMCTQYLHHIHSPIPFPYLLLVPPHRQDLYCPPILRFCKRKKKKSLVLVAHSCSPRYSGGRSWFEPSPSK